MDTFLLGYIYIYNPTFRRGKSLCLDISYPLKSVGFELENPLPIFSQQRSSFFESPIAVQKVLCHTKLTKVDQMGF